jgi:hypothetical protein
MPAEMCSKKRNIKVKYPEFNKSMKNIINFFDSQAIWYERYVQRNECYTERNERYMERNL